MALPNDVSLQEFFRLFQTALKELGAVSQQFSKTASSTKGVIEQAIKIQQDRKDSIAQQKTYLEALSTAIRDLKADNGNPALIRELKEELSKGNKELKEMSGGTTVTGIIGNMQNFTYTVESLTGAINKWIDFNTKMQTMQINAIQTGWENISIGQTPYMSKTLNLMSNYSKESLNIQAEQTRATWGLISKVVGLVGGGLVGGMASGGVGTGIGAGVGMGLATSIMDAVFSMQIANEKDVMNKVDAYTKKFGMMNEIQNNVRLQKIGISGYLSSSGQSSSDSDVMSVRDAILEQSKQFAGIEGFDQNQIAQTLQALGMTKQFGGANQLELAKNVKVAGQTTGLGEQSIMAFITEMSIRTQAPLNQIVDTFGKLNDVSEKLKMPLQQVMEDFKQLTITNQKYGFSQDVLLGLYGSFADEIKKGTMSVADFQKVLQGMSQTATDKATGIGALLKNTDLGTILSGTPESDKKGVSELHNLISGMDVADIGAFLKMASQPDAQRNVFQEQILSKYNISQGTLENMQPNVMKSLLGLSTGYGNQGSGGLGQIIMEAFGDLTGLGMSSDYYTQGLERSQINKLGIKGNFGSTGLKDAMANKESYLESQASPWQKQDIEAYQKYVKVIDEFNSEFAKTGDLFGSFEKVLPELDKTMLKISEIMTGRLEEIVDKMRNDRIDKLSGGKDTPYIDAMKKGWDKDDWTGNVNVKVEASDDLVKVVTKTWADKDR